MIKQLKTRGNMHAFMLLPSGRNVEFIQLDTVRMHRFIKPPCIVMMGASPNLSFLWKKSTWKKYLLQHETNPCCFTLTAAWLSFPAWKSHEDPYPSGAFPSFLIKRIAQADDDFISWRELMPGHAEINREACHRHLLTQSSNQSSNRNQQVQNHTATGCCKSIHSTCDHLETESLHSLLRLQALSQSAKLYRNMQHCWILGSVHLLCLEWFVSNDKQTPAGSTSVSSAWRTRSLPCQRKHLTRCKINATKTSSCQAIPSPNIPNHKKWRSSSTTP